MHICISKLSIIGSYNVLLPSLCQAIIWINAGILLIRTLGTNFSEILNEIHTFYSRKCIWKCCLWNGGSFVLASMCVLILVCQVLYRIMNTAIRTWLIIHTRDMFSLISTILFSPNSYGEQFTNDFSCHNSKLMEILFHCNSIPGSDISTIFCTCHDSTAAVACAKIYTDEFITIWMMRTKWNSKKIWIMRHKSFSEWAPLQWSSSFKLTTPPLVY